MLPFNVHVHVLVVNRLTKQIASVARHSSQIKAVARYTYYRSRFTCMPERSCSEGMFLADTTEGGK